MSEHEQQLKERAEREEDKQVANMERVQEAGSNYADIMVFCHPRNVENLVQSFEAEIKHAAGELPMCVLWSGVSGVLHQGVIILEWEGKVTPAFLHNLSIDHEIFDFVVCEFRVENALQSGKEQEGRDDLEQRRSQAEGKQLI
jgi:hypothetical protein